MGKDDLMSDSDSDESDVDYVPPGEENLLSEEESDGEPEEVADEDDGESKGKRKSRQKKGRNKKSKSNRKCHTDELTPHENKNLDEDMQKQTILTEEEEKIKTDLLWSDFMKSTDRPRPRTASNKMDTKEEATKTEVQIERKNGDKVSITKVFKFAGEEVKVIKEVPADSPDALTSTSHAQPASTAFHGGKALPTNVPFRGSRGASSSGLSAILGKIGKKDKIGTLEKSKLDWEQFKKSEGLEEDLKVHNRGKDGYLEKQDFLQRADVRQFEIEKQLRTTRRSYRP